MLLSAGQEWAGPARGRGFKVRKGGYGERSLQDKVARGGVTAEAAGVAKACVHNQRAFVAVLFLVQLLASSPFFFRLVFFS